MFLQYLAFESPSLDLDVTLFIQTGIFVLLLLFLRAFVLRPYFEAYDARESLTTGAREEANALVAKADALVAEYESTRQSVYAELESKRKTAVDEATAKATEKLELVRQNVMTESQARLSDLDAQLATSRRQMDGEIASISDQIVKKILV